jgi:hypothetical protein
VGRGAFIKSLRISKGRLAKRLAFNLSDLVNVFQAATAQVIASRERGIFNNRRLGTHEV